MHGHGPAMRSVVRFFPRKARGASAAAPLDRTAPLPRVLWIELTSRCPFDCPFCSRRALRGHGANMPLELYRSIVGQLARPETIRLNYSGESFHHPHLVDMIALAAATGAWVELVSVPAAITADRLERAVAAGLNRLTISLHTLDARAFGSIYRFGDLATLSARIDQAAALRAGVSHPFVVDLAFVAMARNLDQLPAIVRLAEERSFPVVAVHPVIRRDAIPERFDDEIGEDGKLRPAFLQRVEGSVRAASAAHPGVSVQLSIPDARARRDDPGDEVCRHPGPLPAGVAIHSCDQDPFETLHVLADGRAVGCEVRDRDVVGDLSVSTLREVWHGEAMSAFRSRYARGADDACRTCEYKQVHRPSALASSVGPGIRSSQLLRGWHASEAGIVWSKREAVVVLGRPGRGRHVELRGLLPGRRGEGNALTIHVGERCSRVVNRGADMAAIEERIALDHAAAGEPVVVRLEVDHAHIPPCGRRLDTRELGFALQGIRVV